MPNEPHQAVRDAIDAHYSTKRLLLQCFSWHNTFDYMFYLSKGGKHCTSERRKELIILYQEQQNVQLDVRSVQKQTYTVKEVAEILDMPVRSAYNLCNNTTDFKVKKFGRSMRVHKESFDDWLNE